MKINLKRQRPRSKIKRLRENDLVILPFSISKNRKDILQKKAKEKGYTLSLYINLIFTGQEKPPF